MTRKKSASLVLGLTAAAALGLSNAAIAQDAYGYYPAPDPGPAYSDSAPIYAPAYAEPHYDRYGPAYRLDDLTVTAPRQSTGRSATTGAPIERVSLSRVVSLHDLDLRTDWGVDAMYERISQAARAACRQIDVMHPISIQGDPPCLRGALEDAYLQAEVAIDAARGR